MAEHGVARHTRQKDALLQQLRACEGFVSAQELHRRLTDSGASVGLATVYRQLNSLAESGAVDTVRLDGQQMFRICDDDSHHHHLICSGCGKTIEIEPPDMEWMRQVARSHGFKINSHTLEIFGLTRPALPPTVSSRTAGGSFFARSCTSLSVGRWLCMTCCKESSVSVCFPTRCN